jgi:aspartate kinase
MSEVGEQPNQVAESHPRSVVMKFGGTSVEDAAAIRRAAQIVKLRLHNKPVVVVSALSDVTDQLLEMGKIAASGDLSAANKALENLRQRHLQVVLDAVGPAASEPLLPQLESDFQQLAEVLKNIAAAGALTPRLQDHLLGLGECLASRIVQAAFVEAGLDAAWVDARACIMTDSAGKKPTSSCNPR